MSFVAPFARTFTALISQAAIELTFLLRDDFTTSDAAPVNTPRTCEPGPGILNFTQTNAANQLSISNTNLVYPRNSTVGNGGAVSSTSYARTPGLALAGSFIQDVGGGTVAPAVWKALANVNQGAGSGERWGYLLQTGAINCAFGVLGLTALHPLWYGVEYSLVSVLRTSGAYLFIKGGLYLDWTLLFVSKVSSTSPVYGVIAAGNGAGSFRKQRTFRVSQLPAPFDSDTAFTADVHSGSISAGQQLTHPANFMYEFTLTTLPGAGVIAIEFRRVDANNFWSIEITSAGAINIYTTVAGVKTLRTTSSGFVAGNTIYLSAYHYFVRILQSTGALVSSTDFYTAQNGQVQSLGTGGAISNLTVYSTETSSEESAILDALFVGKEPANVTKRIVASGDSISIGTGAADVTSIFATKAAAALGDGWGAACQGTGGLSIAGIAALNTERALSLYNSALERNVCVYYAGTNDLLGSLSNVATMTPLATMQSGYSALCQQAKDAGFFVVACTIASLGGTTNYDATVESQRQAFNAWLRLNYTTFADALADIGANATIGAPGACDNTTYFIGKIHPTDAGHVVMGQELAAVIPA